ncbi:SDR family oxidoreductase [Gemmatimonadota bacterium]
MPETAGREIDIGGADVMPYEEILQVMAEELGLRRRLIIPVPVLTPRLSSLWIHLITPLSARIARPLAEGLRNEVVCRDDQAQRLMPQELLGVRQAIHAAVERVEHNQVETQWSMAGPIPGDPDWAGGTTLTDARSVNIEASPAAVYRAVCRVGGGNGWYAADYLWQLRGWMDHMIGGPGLRRGRRNTEEVVFGEALDFWRVIGVERDRRLELRAEMKLPGVASLEFLLEPGGSPGAGGSGTRRDDSAGNEGDAGEGAAGSAEDTVVTRLQQTARFKPRGLFGILYWYSLMPLHRIVFAGMLKGIRRAALQSTRSAAGRSPD